MNIGVEIIRFGDSNAVITWFDVILLTLCPLGAILGTLVSSAIERKKLYKDIPERWYHLKQELIKKNESIDDSMETAVHEEYINFINGQYKYSRTGNYIIALGLGVVVALYFIGAIVNDITSVARVIGLSILLGYQAPNIWSMQQKAIESFATDKLKSLVQDFSKESSKVKR